MSYNVKECYIAYLTRLRDDHFTAAKEAEKERDELRAKRDNWTPETKPRRKKRPMYARGIASAASRMCAHEIKARMYDDAIDSATKEWMDVTMKTEPKFIDPLSWKGGAK